MCLDDDDISLPLPDYRLSGVGVAALVIGLIGYGLVRLLLVTAQAGS